MKSQGTLLLSRTEVADLLSIEEYITAVEQVFRLYGEGKTQPPGILGIHAHDGGFHIKAGLLELDRSFFAAKINANFPQNAKRFDLPLSRSDLPGGCAKWLPISNHGFDGNHYPSDRSSNGSGG